MLKTVTSVMVKSLKALQIFVKFIIVDVSKKNVMYVKKKQCDGCNFYKVKNHNHITGDIIGAAHSYCNINYWRLSKNTPIPVIFHNLKGYDAHHIIGSIYNVKNVEVDDVIAESGEKYKSFVLREKRIKQAKEIQEKSNIFHQKTESVKKIPE